jgi:AcrR family transcriptional regulator
MPASSVAGRDRILDAAQRLMAERGVLGVSLREINEAAAQRNASGVQYHFRNRAGLVAAVVARHMRRIDAERNALLDALEARGRVAPHDVVAALVQPLVAALATPGGRCYLRIVDELLEYPAAAGLGHGLRGLNRSLDRAAHLLRRPLRALPPRLRAERGALCGTFLLRALASRARAVDEEGAARPALADGAFATNLIDVLAAGLVAAPSREARRAVRRRRASDGRSHRSKMSMRNAKNRTR